MNYSLTFITLLLQFCLNAIFNSDQDWFLLKKNDFSISFPGKPSTESQTMDSDAGMVPFQLHAYEPQVSANDENYFYALAEILYPDSLINSDKTEKLDLFFRGSVEDAVKNIEGELLSEKIINIKNYPGREVRISFREGQATITMRMYLVRNKFFMLQTITKTDKTLNKSLNRFMDSFILTE